MWQGFHTLMRLVITVQLDMGQGRVTLLDEVGHHGADRHGAGVPHLDEVAHHGADGHWAGVPHLDELARHGADGHGTGVPHHDEIAHHGAVVHGAGVQHLDELCHHGAVVHGAGVPHLEELGRSYFRANVGGNPRIPGIAPHPSRPVLARSLAQLVIRRRGGRTRGAQEAK